MIKISQTFEVVTHESAEYGDAAERGFDWENADHTFRELVDLIQNNGFTNPDCSHGCPRWLSNDPDVDMFTGDTTTQSIHPSRDRISQKYWEKACRVAGINKGTF